MIGGGWYRCNCCGKKILPIDRESIMLGIPVWCKKCKFTAYPAIYHGRELEDDEPFPLLVEQPK